MESVKVARDPEGCIILSSSSEPGVPSNISLSVKRAVVDPEVLDQRSDF